MVKTNMVIDDCQEVKGEAGELVFIEGNTRVKIVGVDFMQLIKVLAHMGYLREYLEENKDYLEGVR